MKKHSKKSNLNNIDRFDLIMKKYSKESKAKQSLIKGILLAANFAGQFNSVCQHEFNIEDCILLKFNLINKRQVRKNKHYVSNKDSNMKNKGLQQYRFKQNPIEKMFADEWEKQNVSLFGTLDGKGTLDYLLAKDCNSPGGEVSRRDREVAATVIQWLGSPIGQNFLSNVKMKIQKNNHLVPYM
jgi:hypothetical protein